MLEISHVQVQVARRFSLQDITFRVSPGELVAVLGPNGSGKTSLLRAIAGLVAPSAGYIRWSEEVLSSPGRVVSPPEHRATAMLFQEGVLFPHLDVRANVAMGVPATASERECDVQTSEALRMMQIEELAPRSIGALSGGEQQRVALARALAQRPRVLLLDEPFHSLDNMVKRPIIEQVRALVQSRSIAALLVTHDTEEASALCDRIVLTRGGRIVQQGTVQELYGAPADAWIASFMGRVESIETAQARRAGVRLPHGPAVERLYFRPEDLVLDPCGDDREGTQAIAAIRHAGSYVEATIELGDGTSIRARTPPGAGLQCGQRVRARVLRSLVLDSAAADKA